MLQLDTSWGFTIPNYLNTFDGTGKCGKPACPARYSHNLLVHNMHRDEAQGP
jgi:hypothetical protein